MKALFMNAFLVGAGGFAGAILRYGVGGFVQCRFPETTFPLGTRAVYWPGCLAIVGAAGVMLEDGKVRLALGAVGPVRCRALKTEKLVGKNGFNPKTFNETIELLLTEARRISDTLALHE